MEYLDAILYGIGLVIALTIYLPFCPMTIDLTMVSRGQQLWIFQNRRLLWTVVYLCFGYVTLRGYVAHVEANPEATIALAALADPVREYLGASAAGWFKASWITIAMLAFMFWTGYVPYVMSPPKGARLLDIAEADKILDPDEMVLGVTLGGETHAYSRSSIARPHYYTETVGGTPLTISYCILCNSGMAFKNEINGKPITLKCMTAFNNNIIYYDPATKNFIQQLDGVVFDGPDKGAKLETVPVVQATWQEWKNVHPETKLYHAPNATFRDKMVGVMLGWMIPIHKLSKRSKPWHRITKKLDGRLPAMSFVLGVEINGDQAAYPVEHLRDNTVINDTVGGEPIVVLYNAERDMGDVFFRKVNGKTLNFAPADGGAVAKDEETGTTWDVTGAAGEGELSGRSLTAVPHYSRIFWFSWALFKPNTRIAAAA